jgi:transketolase
MPMEPVGYKWKAFNWHVLEVDGFDFRQVIDALEKAESMRNRPTVIIAHTVKGKGVSFMEWDPAYHGKAPDKDTVRKLVKTMLEE